jgi:serine/threonine protein phosphatase PrpC
MNWLTAADSHPGMRRKINEDVVLTRPDVGLWVVADGMGGHAAGDVAARMVADSLDAMQCPAELAAFVDRVEDTLTDINVRIREHSAEHFGGRTMGCTVVTLLARGRAGIALWAGDSRLYRLREAEFVQVTRDHSPLEDLVEQGVLTEEEAEKHPDSNVITRAVGGQSELRLDIAMFDIEPGDTYLLCSDGLYRELSFDEIKAHLLTDDLSASIQALLQLALERGARDNVSIVIARCE